MQSLINLFLSIMVLMGISLSAHASQRVSLPDYLHKLRIPEVRIAVIKDVIATAPLKRKGWTMDAHLLLAIMEQESMYNPSAIAKSGSVGLLQVVPYWHRKHIRGRDIMDPYVNTEVGITVFYQCYKKRKSIQRALDCYNGGGTPGYSDKVIARWRRLQQTVSLA